MKTQQEAWDDIVEEQMKALPQFGLSLHCRVSNAILNGIRKSHKQPDSATCACPLPEGQFAHILNFSCPRCNKAWRFSANSGKWEEDLELPGGVEANTHVLQKALQECRDEMCFLRSVILSGESMNADDVRQFATRLGLANALLLSSPGLSSDAEGASLPESAPPVLPAATVEGEKWSHEGGFIRLSPKYGVNINFPDIADTLVKAQHASLLRVTEQLQKDLSETIRLLRVTEARMTDYLNEDKAEVEQLRRERDEVNSRNTGEWATLMASVQEDFADEKADRTRGRVTLVLTLLGQLRCERDALRAQLKQARGVLEKNHRSFQLIIWCTQGHPEDPNRIIALKLVEEWEAASRVALTQLEEQGKA